MYCQPSSSLIGNVLSLVMIFAVAHNLQNALEMRQESRIVPVDFSAAFRALRESRNSLQVLLCGSWRFCAVCPDRVFLQLVTVCRGEWLS